MRGHDSLFRSEEPDDLRTVARLGGDEFTVILQDLRWPLDAEVVAERILNVCAEPYLAKGQELFLSGSIGITIYPDDAEELEILMRNADAAMYRDEKTTSIIQEIHDMKWLGLFTSNRRKLF